MDLCLFYEKLRKSYNEKRSKLYLNIVRDLNEDSVQEVLTTLASLSLQILLFRPKAENMELFIRASRLDEINKVILHYTNTYDIIPAIKLLRIIKADLKCLEASLK